MRTIVVIDSDTQFLLKLKGLLKSDFNDLAFENIVDRGLQAEYLETAQQGKRGML